MAASTGGEAGRCGLPTLNDASLVEGRGCGKLTICPPDPSASVHDV